MKTRSGKKVLNLVFTNGYYVGTVENKVMTWDVTGRKNSRNRSKNDLTMDKVVVVYSTGKRVHSKIVDRNEVESVRNLIKHYEL
jgi:hypothetical protein